MKTLFDSSPFSAGFPVVNLTERGQIADFGLG